MQNKGLVIFVAVLLTLASIFYLSFSVATSYYDGKIAEIEKTDPIAAENYKDSVKYLGIYSYQKCLETQIGLGLDLKGGMNVILEISVPDVIEVLADHKTDPAFVKSMQEARKQEEDSQKDFITLFIDAYKKNSNGGRLATIFATQQLKNKVNTQSTDEEVEKPLSTTRSTWFVTVSTSLALYSRTSRNWKDRTVVSWSRCLVSVSRSVCVSSCRVVQTWSSG